MTTIKRLQFRLEVFRALSDDDRELVERQQRLLHSWLRLAKRHEAAFMPMGLVDPVKKMDMTERWLYELESLEGQTRETIHEFNDQHRYL